MKRSDSRHITMLSLGNETYLKKLYGDPRYDHDDLRAAFAGDIPAYHRLHEQAARVYLSLIHI